MDDLKSDFRMIQEAMDKKNSYHIDFVKSILYGSSALLGVLVSLQRDNTGYAAIFFCLAVLLLSIGIAALGIVLYEPAYAYKKMQSRIAEEAIGRIRHGEQGSRFVGAPKRKIFAVAEKIALVSLVLSLFCLCFYTFFRTF